MARKLNLKTLSKIFLLSLCIMTASISLHASLVVPPTIEQLVAGASDIVYGEIKKISSHYVSLQSQQLKQALGKRDQIIVTDITFKAITSYKGNSQKELIINQIGGCVLDQCMTISGYPTFRAGETAIFFLNRQSGPDLQVIMGEYGILKVDESGKVSRFQESMSIFKEKLKKIIFEQNQKMLPLKNHE